MTGPVPLRVLVCGNCQGRFLPRPGACPRCGSSELSESTLPPTGIVLAATELLAPAAGWTAPHRLVLAEAAGEVRILAVADDSLPRQGARVSVRFDGAVYRAREEPTPAAMD